MNSKYWISLILFHNSKLLHSHSQKHKRGNIAILRPAGSGILLSLIPDYHLLGSIKSLLMSRPFPLSKENGPKSYPLRASNRLETQSIIIPPDPDRSNDHREEGQGMIFQGIWRSGIPLHTLVAYLYPKKKRTHPYI